MGPCPVTRPTILVVDDHGDFRATARRLLERDGWSVVGEASDGRTGLAAAAALAPDVVLLDIGLPDVDGFEVAERLALGDRPPSVVLISSRDPDTYRERVRSSPAAAFVAKHELDGVVLRSLVRRSGP
jgi:DNA-binding NarL/FixJ family response regulator